MEGNSSSRYSNVEVVKPLLNGCLTGQLHALFRYNIRLILENVTRSDHISISKKELLHLGLLKQIPNKTLLKKELLCEVFCKTASLGTFEILTQRLRNVNNKGMPLSLYQEACCGLISGATTVFVWQPFQVAYGRVGLKHLTYTNWFSSIHNIVRNERASTLWGGSRGAMATSVAAYAGMLASYDRTKTHLIETRGLSKWNAVLSASIISGFFSAACGHPILYVGAMIEAVEKGQKSGAKRVYRKIPGFIFEILTPYSRFKFYTNFLKYFRGSASFCMVQYTIYEFIRGVEWTK